MRRDLTATTKDGVRLHADAYGPSESAATVICLPGLTRNGRDFDALARALVTSDAIAQRVIALTLRGRGRSEHAGAETYTVGQELADVLAAMDEWEIARASFVGTSRGGLIAMLLAASAPERIGRVVLNDIGPLIEPAGLARIAAGVGKQMEFASFAALGETLRGTLGPQFPRMGEDEWTRMARQLASECGGGVRLDYDPRLSEIFRQTSDGPAPDLWPAFAALSSKPLLVVRGAYSDILSAATVEAMRRRHPTMQTLVVVNEGHAPLLWDRHSVETIKAFLTA